MRSYRSLASTAFVGALITGCLGVSGQETPEKLGAVKQAVATSFGAGSLVIPMGNNHQNNGMLRANGLVYALLRANVPVNWAILPSKVVGGDDFTIPGTATVVNRETSANIATPIAYRGGGFIVAAADRTAALAVITPWLAADAVTVVHDVTAGSFDAEIAKRLVVAPSIGVVEDGYEDIAYDHLTAAGIRDSAGNAWATSSPTSFSLAEVASTAGNNADGALFDSGFPAIAFLVSEHYTTPDPEVVAEVRNWLDAGAFTHAFMQCAAVSSYENLAPGGGNPGGRFLTTAGVVTPSGARPTPLTIRLPGDPLAQIDGAITSDTGTIETIDLAVGSTFKTGVRTLLNESDEPLTEEILFLGGNLDGDTTNGRVTYLAGHDYSTTTPVSTNALTNGVRLFYNSIFDSPAALAGAQPIVAITKAAPAITNSGSVTYTLNYANTGTTPAFASVITDVVPTGSTFASAANGGTQAGGTVTWNIGTVAPGATGSVSFVVDVAADATLSNQATMAYRAWQTPRTALSNTTSTIRDATAPDTTIVSGPAVTTTSTNATFDFSSDDGAATFECSLDGGAFATCTDPVTFQNVTVGAHTLQVRAKDAAGNVDPTPASYAWTVGDGGPDASIDPNLDTDGDGLTDVFEIQIGTNRNDADSDDDGVPDGQEASPGADFDGDGLVNALDPDSDNDGLFDGTELGLGCGNPATNVAAGHCIADADNGVTKTDPLNRDTDGGGVSDGSEDANLDGKIDAGETDPTVGHAADDATVKDTDGDGLSDALETTLGSNPADADSDDDGLVDGEEPNPNDDTDRDGKKNIVDPDSDDDGLFDGTELGKACTPPATDVAKGTCIADADNGATKTSPLDPDTDDGGVEDGAEDTNHNGRIDPFERDPNDARDDNPTCIVDSECGGPTSGLVCVASECVAGCRGAGGNGCPNGRTCSSTTEAVGTCSGNVAADAAEPGNTLEGGGFDCAFAPSSKTSTDAGAQACLGALVALALVGSRRRARR